MTLKKTYVIRISQEARTILDKNSLGRVKLSPMFHDRYIDMRPDWLKQAKAWSVNNRQFATEVALSDKQVADLLKLSQLHDIDPRPNGAINPKPRGLMGYLMSTFLDAVVLGYLKEMSVAQPASKDR